MLKPCPTCKGKGSINDPACVGRVMGYYNPHTGDCCPQIMCQSCAGSGWVEDGTPVRRAPVAPTDESEAD